ncbi:MAG: preprotein translocase subunit SecY [Candidatus Schekmanbacteria bacterium RIFCSPHIGHO2_02_FULL_38_11]|uniref:Protein translocase subunit SecY n=1 Tax=Candidatus Schekmanbacteria bacterium RIFCSPLOWO2_12_FULL_38_15 TaxID=1817883 RepID=A0A1F7SLN0_9BACT|nr:MAG: preprotein translocase subunit SecY [Candidatus Schekmanbacteria bacterium GWA2_38_9]OGL50080.1 MAG: preprotein translocase subunit SecY [Candidatus Schekmanbacteria bacterium RIFCSPLOWO2_02_FULL_38_14]OGL50521.1 MAG: preprotein translocase subunit SecY [Candidatus Schekmanbacteria bacterium RIFCSPHIGHO2_02_FULL_38_11]OGL54679.1 MAG: preprotein translocase subunit SecY [Candidatus Schekmanbacteria bacterium RIFCSPLOWO2_12_FULL_38_15]
MIETFQNIFKIPELKKRVIFSLLMLGVYRIGSHIPVPGIDSHALAEFFTKAQGTILGFFDMFSGGGLSRLTVFALGIMPYISASIILQLLTVVIPALERLSKEGEAGRKKITQYTRYGTVALSIIQGLGISYGLEQMRSPSGAPVVPEGGWAFRLLAMITLTAGTAFIMWLGEQITEKGIGNGISLIIFAGIVASMPTAVVQTIQSVKSGDLNVILIVFLIIAMIAIVGLIIYVERGQRKIPVQYAKRVVGRKVYGGQNTHIPLKINTAGVIPVIFASSIIMFPATIASFYKNSITQAIAGSLSPGSPLYEVLYIVFIVFFCYFYTAIVFNPLDLADNMQKYGGFIPGIRPGKRTSDYIDKVLTRITFGGAVYLSAVAVLPDILINYGRVPFYFGGTALLIVVGVAIDTISQIESHLLTRHYQGFLKKGRMKGRRG